MRRPSWVLSTCWPWDVDWSSWKCFVVRSSCCSSDCSFANFGAFGLCLGFVVYFLDLVVVLCTCETCVPFVRSWNKPDNLWIDGLFFCNVYRVIDLCCFDFVADLLHCDCCYICYMCCMYCPDCYCIELDWFR